MTLSLDGAPAPVTATTLARALAQGGEVWAWIEERCAAGRLHEGDAVQIVGGVRSPARCLLPVIDASGVAIVAEPADGRRALGFVRVVVLARDRRPWTLDAQPWRGILASGSLQRWRIAERLRATSAPVTRTLEQLASQPSLADVERSEAGFYGRADVVAGDEQRASEGLTKTEEVIATRFLHEGARVLVVGCGTGRESFALARRGMHVLGIDIAAGAVAAARRRAADAREAGTGSVSFVVDSLARLDLPFASFDLVLIASDVLCGIPGRHNRIAALKRAHELVAPGGRVVMAARSGRGPARVLIEAPRAALRILGLGHREPGDRFAWQGPPPTRRFVHVYADDVELARELATAGLAYDGRVAGFVVASSELRAPPPAGGIFDAAVETVRVLSVLPQVERARRKAGPAELAATMRLLSEGAPRRAPLERARLRSTIAWCDQVVPFGAGCYRRALLEMALDAGAAQEPLVLGLRRHGLGHAWVGAADTEESFDTVVRF
jgi:SAM-dependent methyltransferase